MATNINDFFPSTYLKAYDLKGKTPTVTIDRVEFAQVRGGRTGTVDTKAIVFFQNKGKGLLLNKTNARSIIAIAGTAITEEWRGVAITLVATVDTFGKEKHDVIRIQAPARAAVSPAPPTSTTRRRQAAAIFTDALEIDLADGEGTAY
jgi:hypothetical protein